MLAAAFSGYTWRERMTWATHHLRYLDRILQGFRYCLDENDQLVGLERFLRALAALVDDVTAIAHARGSASPSDCAASVPAVCDIQAMMGDLRASLGSFSEGADPRDVLRDVAKLQGWAEVQFAPLRQGSNEGAPDAARPATTGEHAQ